MTLPIWPASLPQAPLVDGSGPTQLAPEPTRTTFDDGPERVRRRSLLSVSKVAQRFRLTADQLATFEAFHAGDLNAGTRRFAMPIWKPGLIRSRIVRLAAGPGIEARGTYALVTLSLDVWDY